MHPRRNIAMTFGTEKLERFGTLATRRWKKIEDTITRFDRIHERDRQTDGQTLHDGIGRACIASRGKNCMLL